MSEAAPQLEGGIEVSLEQQDVLHLLRSMGELRSKSRSTKLSSSEKNTYLVLATQLGGLLEQHEEGSVRRDVDSLKKMLEKEYTFTQYDADQDNFWRTTQPSFSNTLDHLLITLTQDEFTGLEEKQHLWNAISWLWGKEKPMKNKVELCDTILPETKIDIGVLYPAHLKKEGVQYVEGVGYVARPKNRESLEKLVGILKQSNLPKIGIVADEEAQHFLKNEFPDSGGEGILDSSLKKLGLAPSFRWLHNQGILARGLTYYVFGQTSNYLTSQLERWNTKRNFNQEDATDTSLVLNWIMPVLGLLYCGVGAAVEEIFLEKTSYYTEQLVVDMPGTTYWWAPLIPLAITLAQTCRVSSNRPKQKGGGNIPGTILGFPLSTYFHIKEEKLKKLRLVTIEESNEDRTTNPLPNYHPIMESMARYTTKEITENNLEWEPKNHHTQGKRYAKALRSARVKCTQYGKRYHLTPDLGVLTFYEVNEFTPYTKVSALICQKGERWATTFISKKEGWGDIVALNQWAASHKNIGESQAQELAKMVGAEYLHLAKFLQGKQVEEYKVIV